MKDIFHFILEELSCTKRDFRREANQESKIDAYFAIAGMICKMIITSATVIGIFVIITGLIIMLFMRFPILLLPFSIIILLPYIIMLFIRHITKGKNNVNKN
jgi:cytochrome b subunit of formate dehydrogenase